MITGLRYIGSPVFFCYNCDMEKRTMADIRREKFNRQGQIARELADLALQEIDDALLDYAEMDLGSVVIRSETQITEPIKRLDK